MDKDYAPLSASCVRALNDKLYEKRKVAALEIERMVKDFVAHNNTAQIKRLLKVLGQDFIYSHNPNSRKGGLIGLAATAIALSKDSSSYVDDLVKPVLTCFCDSDSRVRYYGCEALYNIVKVARGSVLPHFNDIFDGLSKLAADPDQNVRSGSELLDRLMKDIVTESCQFDLVSFIPLLRERIYTKNPFARQFIVSWVSTLDAVPDIDMIVFLPDILDGLFQILGDQNTEIRKMTEAALGELLKGINEKDPLRVDFSAMVNIIILHSQSTDPVIQYTAISWLREFVKLSGRRMLPYMSGILMAILPCLAYTEDKQNIKDVSRVVNSSVMKLVGEEDDVDITTPADKPASVVSGEDSECDTQTQSSGATDSSVSDDGQSIPERHIQLDIPSAVEVLTRQLIHDSVATRIAALRWIFHLFTKTPNKMFRNVEELFPLLLKTLSDPSDEVVLLDLEVLAEISSSPAGKNCVISDPRPPKLAPDIQKSIESAHGMNGYFTKFILDLLALFSTDRQLLEDRGSFIIRQLCLLLYSEDIYRCFSEIMLHEDDTRFAGHMIQALSTILLTSTELFELRTQLKDLKTKESCLLFCCLYRAWCHNPVATVALCFLTQNYKQAWKLLMVFGELEVTVNFLTEIDKLVQLIESPIFTYLRLQLLDIEHNYYLVKSLYGLLMLLPQSDAFQTLQHRLQCIPCIHPPDHGHGPQKNPAVRSFVEEIDFDELLEHFQHVQEQHRKMSRQSRTTENIGYNS